MISLKERLDINRQVFFEPSAQLRCLRLLSARLTATVVDLAQGMKGKSMKILYDDEMHMTEHGNAVKRNTLDALTLARECLDANITDTGEDWRVADQIALANLIHTIGNDLSE